MPNISSRITVSMGIATFKGENFNNKIEVVKAADDALNKAKGDGKNRLVAATI